MASSFRTLGLFNSGPHRFAVAPIGVHVIPVMAIAPATPGSVAIGELELVITVSGRLVAASETALWALRDAIAAELTYPAAIGQLIDHHGRAWDDMSFVRFEAGDRTDRGRAVSLAYTARFVRFLVS